MPSCFALYYKDTNERASLMKVDEELCEFLGVPCDKERWVRDWYNTIGLSLAIGHSLEKTKEFFPDKVDIINYLVDHFYADAWHEQK